MGVILTILTSTGMILQKEGKREDFSVPQMPLGKSWPAIQGAINVITYHCTLIILDHTWMSQEVTKRFITGLFHPNIPHL